MLSRQLGLSIGSSTSFPGDSALPACKLSMVWTTTKSHWHYMLSVSKNQKSCRSWQARTAFQTNLASAVQRLLPVPSPLQPRKRLRNASLIIVFVLWLNAPRQLPFALPTRLVEHKLYWHMLRTVELRRRPEYRVPDLV